MPARLINALTELSQAVLKCGDAQALKRLAVDVVSRALGAGYCGVWDWELGANGGAIILQTQVGWAESTSSEVAEDALAVYAMGESVPLLVVDWGSETRFSQPPLLREQGIQSSLYVVIGCQEQRYGVLGIDSRATYAFGAPECDFAKAAANLLALALCGQAARREAVIEERLRLARELHDSVTQAIYSITLQAQAASRLLAAGDVRTTSTYLSELGEAAQEVLEEMRLLIFELRPPLLEQVGLPVALRARLDAVEARANLKTELTIEGVNRLPTEVEQVLYRIAQEALNNALRHSGAQNIAVELRQTQRSVLLAIRDDGTGFDPEAVRDSGGMGLRSIDERVAHAGGQLRLRSAPGAGTELMVEVAL